MKDNWLYTMAWELQEYEEIVDTEWSATKIIWTSSVQRLAATWVKLQQINTAEHFDYAPEGRPGRR